MTIERVDELRKLLSDALFAAAVAHDNGNFHALNRDFEDIWSRAQHTESKSVDLSLALRFWDAWIDASGHGWQSPETIGEDDWPRFARELAFDLASDTCVTNPIVLSDFGSDTPTGVPIRGCIRGTSAILGTFIALLGLGETLLSDISPSLAVFFIGWGALMWFPALARPSKSRAIIASKERRMGNACFLCFAFALFAYVLVWLIERGYIPIRNARSIASQIGSLGAALWLVFFALMLFTTYYQSQLRSLRRTNRE